MSSYTKSGFKAYYDNTAGPFDNSTSGTITGLTLQQFAQDVSDSVLFNDTFLNTDVNYFESWDWNGFLNVHAWLSTTSGAGATVANGFYGYNSTERALGVVEAQTGTTGTGRAAFSQSTNFLFGIGHTIRLRMRMAVQNLGSAGENYTAYFGFGDTPGAGDMANGAYFRYNYAVNSGEFECVTASAGVRTATDSNVVVDTTYKIFEIRINPTASSVEFYIDGVLKATNTTNIPLANYSAPLMKIEKSAGTTTRYLDCDWYDLTVTVSSAR